MRRIAAAGIACLLIAGLFVGVLHLLRAEPAELPPKEIRAVWISFIDLSMPDGANDANEFRQKTVTMLDNISRLGIDTVFVHVRPFSDALYRSDIFPWSACISGTQGVDPGYDPLQVFCETAEQYDVQVHAWINPFRICSNEENWSKVSEDNPARQMLRDADPGNDSAVVHVSGGVYYDPASPAVRQLILSGVRELLENYPIRGIHIDDYFYPSQDDAIDETEYTAYREQGGDLPRDDWRRETVSAWIRDMYTAVKSFGSEKVFSISPAVNVSYNRDTLYADVERWCGEDGFCDWMIPQVYVGFDHAATPFEQAAAEWDKITTADSVRLLFGLGAYKCGQTDDYAGSGSAEWIRNTDILSRQIKFCRTLPHGSGFSFFSYGSFFGENVSDHAKKELQFVTSVL